MSWLTAFFGRKTPAAPVGLWSGRVLSALEFQSVLQGWEPMADASYAVVSRAALPAFYAWFKARLSDLGVVRWDPALDCDNWSRLYADLLNVRFYLSKWDGGRPQAESAAVAIYWYNPGGDKRNGHAIVAIYTDAGLVFVEPQTGEQVTLSDSEIASHFRVMA